MGRYKKKMRNGIRKEEHKWIMEDFLCRPLTSGEIVHHINNNPKDNRLENLELTIQSCHARCHLYESGAYGIGDDNPNSKLTSDQVRIIKELLGYGLKIADIGDIYNVSKSTVSDIKRGLTWGHI